MKKRYRLFAITLVIATLLMTSITGIIAQTTSANNEKNLTDNNTVKALLGKEVMKSPYGVTNYAATGVKKVIQSSARPQVISTMAQEVKTMTRPVTTRSIIIAMHPAITFEPNGFGAFLYDLKDTTATGGEGDPQFCTLAVGFNDFGDNIGASGLYWVDSNNDAIRMTYPSMHFRNYDRDTGFAHFTGTVNDGYANMGEGGLTNGGSTFILQCIGDPTNNLSWTPRELGGTGGGASSWDWHTYGWNMADDVHTDQRSAYPHASNAPAYFKEGSESTDFSWGINSFIMDTTYTYPEMIYNNFKTDGTFLQYAGDAQGNGWIDWFEETGTCFQVESVIDSNADLFADPEIYATELFAFDDYSETITWSIPDRDMDYMPYVAYTVSDPKNFTYNKHSIAIRADDWLGMSVYNNSPHASGLFWIRNMTKELVYPTIACDSGNLIVAFENRATLGSFQNNVEIWRTGDGNPLNLEKVVTITGRPLQKWKNPTLTHIQGDTYVMKVFLNNSLLAALSYDGGQTWNGMYYVVEYEPGVQEPVVDTYRPGDTSDYGFMNMWNYDNSSGGDTSYNLYYQWGAVKYGANAFYYNVGGEPAPLSEYTIENIELVNQTMVGNVDATGDGNHAWRFLLYGFDIWEGTSLRVIAKGEESGGNVNITDVGIGTIDPAQHIFTTDVVLNVHYRDLKSFPFLVRKPNTGGAVIAMMTDYLAWNSLLHPRPLLIINQTLAYNTYKGADTVIDAQEMANGLNTEIRPYDPNYAYFFQAESFVNLNDALMNICRWIDFDVAFFNDNRTIDVPTEGYTHHVPVAVPINQSFNNWVAIRGIHTTGNAWYWHEAPPSITIKGFWVNDPDPSRIDSFGGNSYKTADTFTTKYYKPIAGVYWTVNDPPQIEGLTVPATGSVNIDVYHYQAMLSAKDTQSVKKAVNGIGKVADVKLRNAAIENVRAVLTEGFDYALLSELENAVGGKVIIGANGVVVTLNGPTVIFNVAMNLDGSLKEFSIGNAVVASLE